MSFQFRKHIADKTSQPQNPKRILFGTSILELVCLSAEASAQTESLQFEMQDVAVTIHEPAGLELEAYTLQ